MIPDHVIRYINEKRWIQLSIPYLILFWTLLILYLTLFPSDAITDTRLFSYDKLGHFGMFGGWTGLIGLYFLIYKKKLNAPLFAIAILGILFGAFIEFMQFLMPFDRYGNFDDFLANSLGCMTAYGILAYLRHHLRRIAQPDHFYK